MIENIHGLVTEFVSPQVLWLALGAIVLVFVIVSTALMYHWRNYGVNSRVIDRVIKVYFIVSLAFILAMTAAVSSYSL